jgi:uncharacterized cupin superfamily protein
MKKPLVNLRDVPRHGLAHGSRFEATVGRVGTFLGARRLGYSIVEVPPGKRSCPYHVHHNIEEMFIVLEGTGTLRFGADSHPLMEGDVVCARAGEEPHQIVNTSQSRLRYLCVSTIEETDVVDYPDAHKIGIAVGTGVAEPPRMHFLREGREVDYWEGEP